MVTIRDGRDGHPVNAAAREMSLADAQKCIVSNWVECWEKYVVPEYGPQWAAANRHGW